MATPDKNWYTPPVRWAAINSRCSFCCFRMMIKPAITSDGTTSRSRKNSLNNFAISVNELWYTVKSKRVSKVGCQTRWEKNVATNLMTIRSSETAEKQLTASIPTVLILTNCFSMAPIAMRAAGSFVTILALIFLQTVLIAFHFDPGSSGAVERTPADHPDHTDQHSVADGYGQHEILRFAVITLVVIVAQPPNAQPKPNNFHQKNHCSWAIMRSSPNRCLCLHSILTYRIERRANTAFRRVVLFPWSCHGCWPNICTLRSTRIRPIWSNIQRCVRTIRSCTDSANPFRERSLSKWTKSLT